MQTRQMPGFPAPLLSLVISIFLGCDQGFSPPEDHSPGAISGIVSYTGVWPSPDSLHDLRFVGMRFVPTDTTDFLQLNRMVFSERLAYNVSSDSFKIEDVAPGVFFYSGIAQQFSGDLLSWRPVGLYETDNGIFVVKAGETISVEIFVDFQDLPRFPPEQP